jgi:hypothetical protein
MKHTDNKRIIKFNSSIGAILCNGCRVIVMDGFENMKLLPHQVCTTKRITDEDWKSDEPVYCDICKRKMKNEN